MRISLVLAEMYWFKVEMMGLTMFCRIFDFREISIGFAHVMSQSLNHKIMYYMSAIY